MWQQCLMYRRYANTPDQRIGNTRLGHDEHGPLAAFQTIQFRLYRSFVLLVARRVMMVVVPADFAVAVVET
jgi:hypothetical protein